jgi:hypothetical protein
MKRIATPNRAVDKFGAGKDGFRAAVAGVSSATEFSDLWFNHVQEAILRVIERAGLVLSDTDFDQFMTAVSGEGFSGVKPLAVSTVLTVADLGKLIKVTATGATITLPPIAQVAGGQAVSVISGFATGTVTLKGNAAEVLATPLGATANTFTLNAGEAIQFVSNGVSWDSFGYEATVGVTPPQFDSSTKLATMAALKQSGMQHSGPIMVSVSRAITALESIGNFVLITGNSGPITITLPSLAACPPGGSISFLNSNIYDVTISRAGADGINPGGGGATSTLVLHPGDTLSLTTVAGVVNWQCFGGSAALATLPSFAASLSPNGFRKSPSGEILQWGSANTSASADVAVTFPIPFPVACNVVVATINSNVVGFATAVNGMTQNGFNLGSYSSSSVRAVATTYWIAIGK